MEPDFVWVIGVFVIGVVGTLSYYYAILPGFIANFMISVTIAGLLIYSGLRYWDISSRWNMDFDKVALNPPNISQSAGGVVGSGLVVAANGSGSSSCTDAGCCDQGTTWDASKKLCVAMLPKT